MNQRDENRLYALADKIEGQHKAGVNPALTRAERLEFDRLCEDWDEAQRPQPQFDPRATHEDDYREAYR